MNGTPRCRPGMNGTPRCLTEDHGQPPVNSGHELVDHGSQRHLRPVHKQRRAATEALDRTTKTIDHRTPRPPNTKITERPTEPLELFCCELSMT